jgi:hypothetical protein
MANSVTLVYLSSDYIVDYITRNPIEWKNKEMARRGGVGDSAGRPPTLAVSEFLNLLGINKDLFTQKDFAEYCCYSAWADWFNGLNKMQQLGVEAKIYCNFYPSMIDSLHVWALLCETGYFKKCILDAYKDAAEKTDLTVSTDGAEYKIALYASTKQSLRDRNYKILYRGGAGQGVIYEVPLPMNRPKAPGNKRWYKIEDFNQLIEAERITQDVSFFPKREDENISWLFGES